MNENNVSVICESCGATNNLGSNFCASCGSRLGTAGLVPEISNNPVTFQDAPYQNYENAHQESRQSHQEESSFSKKEPKPWYNYTFDINEFDKRLFNPSDKEVSNFLSSNQAYYFSQFNKMKKLNKNTSWNWVAFFFPIPWLAYRKMYIMAILTFVVSSILGTTLLNVAFGMNILLSLLWGFFGNIKYMEYIENSFIEAHRMGSRISRASYLESKGGTNLVALLIIGLLVIGFILSPMVIAMMFFWSMM